jgi:hypothetical protein
MGRNAEVLDAFVFGKFDFGERAASFRLGRHTLLWGESLFFGSNGIAGGQAPVDLIKLLSVPNSTFKEIARPTGKLSGQVQVTDAVSVGAYYGYEWEPTRLMPVGAFLSTSDALGPGGERIMAGPIGTFARTPDQEPKNGGQGGVQVRWRADAVDTDFGFYAIRFHAYGPSNIYTTLNGVPPALAASSYRWVYHEGARAYGASFRQDHRRVGPGRRSLGARQRAAGEQRGHRASERSASARLRQHRQPRLCRRPHRPCAAVLARQPGPELPAREASFLGEIAWNTRMKVTQGRGPAEPERRQIRDLAARGVLAHLPPGVPRAGT